MVQLSFLRTSSRWAMAAAISHCLLSSCAASYLRDATPMARELQSLPTIDDIVLADSNLTTLAVAFETAQLVGALCTNCNYTAFAPTNEAFAALDQEFLATLLTPSWILHLQNLLAFHATLPTDDGNRLLSTNYIDGQIFEMLNIEQVTVKDLKSGITLTSPLTVGSKIVEADILASNGAVQIVDTVLSPGFFGVDVFALGDSFVEFTILQELMELIGLAGTEGEFTILAPTNAAFLSLGNETLAALKEDKDALGNILANHVIVGVYPSIFLTNGLVLESLGGLNITVTISDVTARQADASTTMFNDATVIRADVLAKNGIVHAIDTVLIDPDPVSDVPSTLSSDVPSDAPSSIPSDVPSSFPSNVPSDTPSGNPTLIVSLFENLSEVDPEFSILDGLFSLTGLGDLEGEFTLLAPENDAWSALGNNTVASLQNNVAVLESLLRNHLVAGAVSPEDLVGGGILTTLGGETVTVTAPAVESDFIAAQQTTGIFMFNDASSSDIFYAGNGIIYKIDAVLFDPAFPIASDPPAPAPVPLPITPPVSLPITPPVSLPITQPVSLPISPPISLPMTPPVSLPINPPTPLQIPVTVPTVEPNIPTAPPVNELTPVPAAVSESPSSSPTVAADFCIDFACGDGYDLVSDAATRPGNDRATCCFFAGVCAGAPVGAMCSLGDIESSLIPNPSFEEFSFCPNALIQLSFSIGWEQATDATSDYFIGSPTCDDSWYQSGILDGLISQNATDGSAFVGSAKSEGYYEYIGACLNRPLVIGTEYTFTLNLAAANADFIFGGDTNGETDLLCIPTCGLFPIAGRDYKGNDFEILSTAAPEGGLVGGDDWKTITFNFVATSNCSAIMFGPSIGQTVDISKLGSYVIYDFLNLQEGTAGMCNADGECVPADSSPISTPAPSTDMTGLPLPTPTPTAMPPPSITPNDVVVSVEDYYVSFIAPEAEQEPTPAEYDEMRVRINDWFEMQLSEIYDNATVQFLRSETTLNSTNYGFGFGIPPRPNDFNIYMNFTSTKYIFTGNSTTVPTTATIFEIMQSSITPDFIGAVVGSFIGSPFESTNEVVLSLPSNAPYVVSVEGYSISFVAPGAEREPDPTEYDDMRVRINGWFARETRRLFFSDFTSDVTVLGTETSLNFTIYGFGNGIPPRPDDFNIYMNFTATKYLIAANASYLPEPTEILEVMRDSITTNFILDVVRTFIGSPFETTNEVFFSERL